MFTEQQREDREVADARAIVSQSKPDTSYTGNIKALASTNLSPEGRHSHRHLGIRMFATITQESTHSLYSHSLLG